MAETGRIPAPAETATALPATAVLPVAGMTCTSCARLIEWKVGQLAGIRSARLWRQLGGHRWQLVFSRGKLLKALYDMTRN